MARIDGGVPRNGVVRANYEVSTFLRKRALMMSE